jgi:hypothetical protein
MAIRFQCTRDSRESDSIPPSRRPRGGKQDSSSGDRICAGQGTGGPSATISISIAGAHRRPAELPNGRDHPHGTRHRVNIPSPQLESLRLEERLRRRPMRSICSVAARTANWTTGSKPKYRSEKSRKITISAQVRFASGSSWSLVGVRGL